MHKKRIGSGFSTFSEIKSPLENTIKSSEIWNVKKLKKNPSGPIVKRKKRGLQREPWHLIDHGQETPKDSSKMLFTQYVWNSFQNCLNNWLRLKVNSSSHMFVFRPGFILKEFLKIMSFLDFWLIFRRISTWGSHCAIFLQYKVTFRKKQMSIHTVVKVRVKWHPRFSNRFYPLCFLNWLWHNGLNNF